jgi:predicted PurR-regulated permease PerM
MVLFLERKKFPKALANLLSILLLITILTGALYLMYQQISNMVSEFPQLRAQIMSNIDQLYVFIEETFGVVASKQEEWVKESINNLFESGSDFSKKTLSSASSTLFKMGILPVFIFYLLFYREKILRFIMAIAPREKKAVAIIILKKISTMIQNYMSGIFVVILILSVMNSVGLAALGMKYAITFGIISALFNFIPYFGSWMGASIPVLFALIAGDDPMLALSVFAFYVVVIFIEHNILTPNITGVYVNLNPLFTIFGIIIGSMVWGIAGMFVVLPLMATIKIIFDHNTQLMPFAALIGHQKHAEDQNMIKKLINRIRKKKRNR